jgi:hypothetical protein
MAAALIKQNILPASAILRKCRPLEVHKSVLLNTKNLQKGFVVLLTRMHLIKMGLNGGVLLTGYWQFASLELGISRATEQLPIIQRKRWPTELVALATRIFVYLYVIAVFYRNKKLQRNNHAMNLK